MKNTRMQYLAISLSCAVLPVCSTLAVAETNFAGKRVEMTVPFSAGGGADGYARLVAGGLSKALPGQPTVVVKNLPGGGSIVGMNQFNKSADKDGTDIALSSTSTTLTVALRPKDPTIQFEARKWRAFFATPLGRVMYVHSKTGIKTIEDLKANKDKELVLGLESPTGSDMPNLLSLKMLGLNIKVIFGIDGGDEQLAFERGELTINGDPMAGYLPTKDNPAKIALFSFGVENEKGEIVRDPNVPNLPTFIEAYRIIHGKDPSGPEFDAWMALFHIAVMGSKAVVLPGDTPPEVIKAYDDAAAKVIADAEFQKKALPITGDYRSIAGEPAAAIFLKATDINPATREWLIKWLNTNFNAGL